MSYPLGITHLHVALRSVHSKVMQGLQKPGGICNNARYELSRMGTLNTGHVDRVEALRLLDMLFAEWPKFSGNHGYPVPDPEYPSSDRHAEGIYHARNGKWETRSEYGRLRLELLNWLIARTAPPEPTIGVIPNE
jgi:hypothetical protein